jgi:hypothetical protein
MIGAVEEITMSEFTKYSGQANDAMAQIIQREKIEDAGAFRIKRITSHSGHARYLAGLTSTTLVTPRIAAIPSPYAFSATHQVYQNELGQYVIIVETAHKQYDVFRLNKNAPLTNYVE